MTFGYMSICGEAPIAVSSHAIEVECSLDRCLCWTRMQAESGEGLVRILRRKNFERLAGDGLFFWGIGNAPSRAIPALARATAAIDVLFSVMKSRPKAQDMSPSRVLAWQSYVNADGIVRPLPKHVLVTSRAGNRDCHYALVCHSNESLAVSDGGPFDPTAFRNYGAGGAVGASQVTALIERCAPDGRSEDYRVAMRARLTGGLWVKLVDPVEVTASARARLDRGVDSEGEWLELVNTLRTSGCREPLRHPTQVSLFAV